jgi:hypothetical protein
MAWGVHNMRVVGRSRTEVHFEGSYVFQNQETHEYEEFTTPYSGLGQAIKPDGLYHSQPRSGLNPWHIVDPIRFDPTCS